MSNLDLAKLLETQISLTEWLDKIDHAESGSIRQEDNVKRVRIGKVNEIIGLPYDKPTHFQAVDLKNRTKQLKVFVLEHGNELCVLRLMPKKGLDLPKLRMRGKTIKEALKWFDDQAEYYR